MRRIVFILIAILATVQLSAQDRVSKIREKLLNRDQSTVIVASHRGDWRNFPENSLEAIECYQDGCRHRGTGCTTYQRR